MKTMWPNGVSQISSWKANQNQTYFPHHNVYHQLHTQFATISECLQHSKPHST